MRQLLNNLHSLPNATCLLRVSYEIYLHSTQLFQPAKCIILETTENFRIDELFCRFSFLFAVLEDLKKVVISKHLP